MGLPNQSFPFGYKILLVLMALCVSLCVHSVCGIVGHDSYLRGRGVTEGAQTTLNRSVAPNYLPFVTICRATLILVTGWMGMGVLCKHTLSITLFTKEVPLRRSVKIIALSWSTPI